MALLLRALFACLCFSLAGATFAQAPAGDPPGRVARLADLTGPAWFYHPDNGDWAEAVRNLPLTTGDRLATDPNTRAELQVGSTTLRLDGGSELEVVAIDDTRIALQLRAGVLTTRVRNVAEAGQVDVLTDDGRFLVLRAGSYRFDRGTRSSVVMVDAGEVRYEFATSALTVGAGQRGEFWIDANGAAQYALLAPTADAFTAWNAERDRAFDAALAARYASPEMTGVQDLDRYGTWEQTPDYGAVWFPTAVAVDWAPYSAGRWAWVQPWGWTWVDDAPWGFAPFHYGRWVNLRNRWCWTPGVREPRPVWAPALVGWIGGPPPGGGRGGPPAVGWFPLAPREVFVPGYASTPRYIRSLNQPSFGNPALLNAAIANPRPARDFENRRFPRAVTIVPATVLTERRPVAPAASQYRDAPWARDFAQAGGPGRVATAPPVAPPTGPAPGEARRPPRAPPGFADERGGRPGGPPVAREASRLAEQAPAGATDPRLLQRGERDRGGAPDRGVPPGPGRAPAFGTGALPAGAAPPPTQDAARAAPPAGWPGRGPQPRGPTVEAAPSPPVPTDAQSSPRMRVLPVRRGDDRRPGDESVRPDAAPMLRPRGDAPARPQPDALARPVVEAPRAVERPVPAPPAVQRPIVEAPAVPRPTPQRAVEAPAPRPVEMQRPAPAEAQRPPAEAPRVAPPERRNEPGPPR